MEKDGAVTQRQAEKDDGRHVRLRERERDSKPTDTFGSG